MAWYDSLPINSGFEYVIGTTTGNYNDGNTDALVKTWLEYKVTQSEADKEANRSVVRAVLYSKVIPPDGSSTGMSSWTTADNFGYVGYDGANRQYLSTTYNFNNYAVNKFADYTFTIPHNSDGTKTITLQGAFQTHSGTWAITGGSVSFSLTLPTISIARGTEITGVSFLYYGMPTQFYMSRKSSNFREQVTMTNGSTTLTIKTTSVSDVNFEYNLARSYTPNTAYPSSSTWTVSVNTYNGATLVETKTYSYTWSISPYDIDSYRPYCTYTVEAYNDRVPALSTDTVVSGYSKLNVKVLSSNVHGRHGATVNASAIVVRYQDGWAVAGSGDHISGTISYSGRFSFRITITDSRGISKDYTDYWDNVLVSSAPTLDVKECYRGDSSGNVVDGGAYIWAKITTSCDSLNNHNSIQSRSGKVGSGSAVTMAEDTRVALTTSAAATSAYEINFTISDLLRTTSVKRYVSAEGVPLNIGEGGQSVGIGAYAENDDELKIGYNTRAIKPITVEHDGDSSVYPYVENYIELDAKKTQGTQILPYVTLDRNRHDSETDSRLEHLFIDSIGWNCNVRNYANNTQTSSQTINHVVGDLQFNDYYGDTPYDGVKYRVAHYRTRGIQLSQGDTYASDTKVDLDASALNYGDRIFASCNMADETLLKQGAISATGEDLDTTPYTTNYVKTPLIKATWSRTYTVSYRATNSTQKRLNWFEYDSRGYFLRYDGQNFSENNSVTFTTGNDTRYIRLQFNNMSGNNATTTTIDEFEAIQCERGTIKSQYFTDYVLDNLELTNRKYVQDWESKNIADVNSLTQGYITAQGAEGDDATTISYYVKSGFCKVDCNTQYTLTQNTTSWGLHVFEYDANKTFLRYTPYGAIYARSKTFSAHEGTRYIRVQLNKVASGAATQTDLTYFTSLQVVKGASECPSVPFAMDNEELSRYTGKWMYCGEVTNQKVYFPKGATEIALVLKISSYTFPMQIFLRETLTQTTNVFEFWETSTGYLRFYFNYQASLCYIEKNSLTNWGSGWNDWHVHVYAK